jgi:integrase/recombinase XerC
VVDGTRRVAEVVELSELCVLDARSSTGSADQAARVQHHIDAFVDFAQSVGIAGVTSISPGACEAFVRLPTPDGVPPSPTLMRRRRTALRFVFRLARDGGLLTTDPTIDLDLPPSAVLRVRPLTDREVEIGRGSSLWSLTDTRRAAAWALAEATARSSEIARVRVADVHLEAGRVWLAGGKTTRSRWGDLSDWGSSHLSRRLAVLQCQPAAGVVYQGKASSGAGQVAACTAVAEILQRAGLSSDPAVRPGSVVAWAGRRILEETGRIDVVAQRLGMSSLDRVAELIGWDWRIEEPDR